jgi:tetratricopeptide (TPR) repeat protein
MSRNGGALRWRSLFVLVLVLFSCQTVSQRGAPPWNTQLRDGKAHLDRGMLLSQNGEHEKAIEEFNKALSLNPRDGEAYRFRGFSYYFMGEYDRALSDYKKAAEIDPANFGVYSHRALIYEARGLYDQAIGEYNKVISIEPTKAGPVHHNIANICLLRGQYEEGILEFTKALQMGPELPGTYLGRGTAYSKMNRYDEAIADFNKAIQMNPGEPYGYVQRGLAYKGKEHLDQGLLDFNRAIERDRWCGEAYLGLAQVHYLKEDYDRAWDEAYRAVDAGFHIPPEFMDDLRRASLKQKFGPGGQPLSKEQLEAVKRAEVIGRAIYDQDIVSARATDALMAKLDLKKDKGPGGWITVQKDSKWLVRFLTKQGENHFAAYDISFWSPKGPTVVRKDPPEKLGEMETQMVLARDAAISAMPYSCSKSYNPVILPGEMEDFDGWLVYLLAATAECDKMVVGGHFRVHVSRDGKKVWKVEPLSKSCLTVDLAELKRKEDVVYVGVTQLITDTPIETHVFLSLLHKTPFLKTPFRVKTKAGVWQVSNGLVRFLSLLPKEKEME